MGSRDSVSAGESYNCAIRSSDGGVVCWGYDHFGQVSGAPSGVSFDSVSAGRNHTCAIRSSDGWAICWGSDTNGQVSGAPRP